MQTSSSHHVRTVDTLLLLLLLYLGVKEAREGGHLYTYIICETRCNFNGSGCSSTPVSILCVPVHVLVILNEVRTSEVGSISYITRSEQSPPPKTYVSVGRKCLISLEHPLVLPVREFFVICRSKRTATFDSRRGRSSVYSGRPHLWRPLVGIAIMTATLMPFVWLTLALASSPSSQTCLEKARGGSCDVRRRVRGDEASDCKPTSNVSHLSY